MSFDYNSSITLHNDFCQFLFPENVLAIVIGVGWVCKNIVLVFLHHVEIHIIQLAVYPNDIINSFNYFT